MKIVFWSPLHGQTGSTSNILAVALLTGLYYRKRSILTQTHFQYNNLEAPLVGVNPYQAASKEYFREVGIDTIIRCFKAAKLDKDTIENCCIALGNTKLLLLPGTSKTIKEVFDYEMEAVMGNLLKAMEEVCGIVLVDLSSGDNTLSHKLMQEADLIVVNLCQNTGVVEEYFQRYAMFMQEKKVFYLFGKYDRNSKYNISNLRRKYNKMKAVNSGVIPYSTGFMDAMTDGHVIDFFRSASVNHRREEEYYFMSSALKTTRNILNQAGAAIERAGWDGQ